jgi:N-acylneuraminate cytidylyltransferase
MIEGSTVLAVIPARGGSKGFPGKNIADLGGKPLVAWSIEAAQSSGCVDRVVVSSDSEEIIDVARQFGADVPFIRPANLAEDDTTTWETLAHVLNELPDFDLVVLLQPTSPLRTATDIDAAVRLSVDSHAPVIGVCPAPKPPEWLYYLGERGHMEPVLSTDKALSRRQEARPAFAINGAIYVATVEWLLKNNSFMGPETLAYEMPAERSLDIDSALDLQMAASLLNSQA